MTDWTDRELKYLPRAYVKKICVLQPAFGRCQHACCRELWAVTEETATDQERAVLWPDLPLFGDSR